MIRKTGPAQYVSILAWVLSGLLGCFTVNLGIATRRALAVQGLGLMLLLITRFRFRV